jgi:hypothetical protein
MPRRGNAERATFITRDRRRDPVDLITPRTLRATVSSRERQARDSLRFQFRQQRPNAANQRRAQATDDEGHAFCASAALAC